MNHHEIDHDEHAAVQVLAATVNCPLVANRAKTRLPPSVIMISVPEARRETGSRACRKHTGRLTRPSFPSNRDACSRMPPESDLSAIMGRGTRPTWRATYRCSYVCQGVVLWSSE